MRLLWPRLGEVLSSSRHLVHRREIVGTDSIGAHPGKPLIARHRRVIVVGLRFAKYFA